MRGGAGHRRPYHRGPAHRRAIQLRPTQRTVDVVVGPWSHLQTFGGPELAGKVVITDRAAPHVVDFLLERGVVHVAATYPSVALPHNLDWSVMEAMLWITDGNVGTVRSSSPPAT